MVFNLPLKNTNNDPDSKEVPTGNSFTLFAEDSKRNHKFGWYCAFVFAALWYLIFYVTIIPSFYYFPKMLTIKDEAKHKDKFIGERAEKDLFNLASIGVKVVGSQEYFIATNYMMQRVEEIKSTARLDLYDIDIQLQTAKGEFFLWDSLISYADIHNVIVKVKPKNVTSEAALLVNSHYDSEIGSPAAGDAGLMIVIMLETMRVITQSEKRLDHTIIFLFNGGEENPMMGSHAFITSHDWAKEVRALINLDSAGNGGREILFQSGPDHPWLMKYYHKSVPSPFASTIAEELFQNNFIPSDTDFRIFRDYGGVPGLDMAHTYGGYTYHMKFDSFKNIPVGSFQLTGDNVLALTRSLANAYELDDTEKYKEGHTVFYDVVGWFLVSYTEKEGIIINSVVSAVSIIVIGLSLWLMFKDITIFAGTFALNIFNMFAIQAASILAAVGINILVAVVIDAMGLPLAWYTSPWMLFGLYFCPAFFTLGFGSACYLTMRKNNPIPLRFCVQIFMHSHAFVLTIFTIVLTGMGIRSAFFPMVAVFFYTISVIMNLVTRFYKRGKLWTIPHCLCQILPYWFYTYLSFAFLVTFIPMQARIGPGENPEILLAIFTVLFAILFAGFLIPLLNLFRKTKILFSLFAILFVLYVIIAATPAGFPYKEEEAPQRFYVLNTNRVFNEFNGTVSRSESGYFVMPVDRRPTSIKKHVLDFDKRIDLKEDCENEVFCGVPLYSGRWLWWGKEGSYFIPGPKPDYTNYPEIKVLSTTVEANIKKFKMEIYGPSTTIIFVKPLGGSKLVKWNRSNDLFEKNVEPPYFLYFSYADKMTPFELEMEFEKESDKMDEETVQIVVAGHWVFNKDKYTKEFNEFLDSWPTWTYQTSWYASYESWKY